MAPANRHIGPVARGELFAHVARGSVHVPNVDGQVAQMNDTPRQISVLATQVDDYAGRLFARVARVIVHVAKVDIQAAQMSEQLPRKSVEI